ncbi:Cof-type HAD-IIB family hydrolase [Paratractidigestivibacter sp.]|uniref:Cof-type HAD-IIB family hydrolase n=1 Tax=Paratractidigestivibacter sp. TaxID=2847316 RepID=UPI002ACB0910|nr:Cof-type HAD-IIB family hydrolase [Paratractidigestivibacter sp.]
MAFELIAFDMDGTLLDSCKEVLPSSIEAVSEAVAAGKVVAISSGRVPHMIEPYREILPGIRYAVCSAGAQVFDLEAGRALRMHPMDCSLVEKCIAVADEISSAGNYVLEVGDDKTSILETGELALCGACGVGVYEGIFRSEGKLVDDAHAIALDPTTPVCKMVMHLPSVSQRDQVHAKLAGENLMISDCEVSSIEFTAAGVNKGTALMELAEVLDLEMSQVIAVGDAENDVAMLRAAGLGVAMGNAIPAAVAAADVQVSDCDHGGCAESIRRFLLTE